MTMLIYGDTTYVNRALHVQAAELSAHVSSPACITGWFAQLLRITLASKPAVAHRAAPLHKWLQKRKWSTMASALLLVHLIICSMTFRLRRAKFIAWLQLSFICTLIYYVAMLRPYADVKYFGFYWHHRLLLMNIACVVARMPMAWFVLITNMLITNSATCWLAAAAAYVADSSCTCGFSPMCILSALTAQSAEPMLFARELITAALSKHLLLLVGFIIPVLLLKCFHLRHAYTARQLQKHSFAVAQQQQHQQAASVTHPAVSVTHPDTPTQASIVVTAAFDVGMADVSIAALDTAWPASSTVASCCPASSAIAQPATLTCSASFAECPAAPAQANTAGSSSPATAAAPPVTSAIHSATGPTGGDTVFSSECQLQKQPSALYCSPLRWHAVSFKFTTAPSTSPSVLRRFERQLAATMQAAVNSAMLSPSLSDGIVSSTQQTPLVLKVAAFPGCYQILLQLSLPKGSSHQQLQLFLQQLRRHTDPAVEQMLAAWPDVQLIGTSLDQVQQQNSDHLESLELSSSSAVVAEGVYLQPVALAWPHASSHANPASPGSSSLSPPRPNDSSVHANLDLKLCLSQAAVSQLRLQGMHAVRVVAAPQHHGETWLFDKNWQLPIAQQAVESAISEPVEPAMAFAGDFRMHLQLELPRDEDGSRSNKDNQHAAQQQGEVLTVVLLRGDDSTADTPPQQLLHTMVEGTAGLAAVDTLAGPTAMTAASLHGVVASLPLMVLPAGAAEELQQMFDQFVREGLFYNAAYHQLRLLLHDLAVVLGAGGELWQEVPQELVDALSACFTQHDLQECSQLLSKFHCSPARGRDSSIIGADDQLGLGAVAAATVYTAKMDSAEVSKQFEKTTNNAASAADTCQSVSTDISCKDSTLRQHSAKSSVSDSYDGAPSSSCSSLRGVGAYKNSTQDFTGPVFEPDALQLRLSMLLYGFQVPAEAAYRAYKSAILVRHDLTVFAFSAMSTVAALIKMAMLVVSTSSSGLISDNLQIVAAGIYALFAGIHASMCLLAWLAVARPRRFGVLHRCRSALLYATPVLVWCISGMCLVVGGVLSKAILILGPRSGFGWWPLIIQRHAMMPALVYAGIVPGSVSYLVLQLLLIDPIMNVLCGVERPEVAGLGAGRTAGLIAVMHLAVAVVLEALMRRSFVRHVAASRSRLLQHATLSC